MIELNADDFFGQLGQRMMAGEVPHGLHFAPTYRCPLRCVHCYAEGQCTDEGGDELQLAEIERILDQFCELGLLRCTLSGGDPLARTDFSAIYRAIAMRGIRQVLFTSATTITEPICSTIATYPPEWIEVTLYGARADTHDAITGIPGSFRRALSGLRQLKEAGLCIRIKSMAMRDNAAELSAIRDLAVEYGDGSFRIDGQLMGRLDGSCGPHACRVTPEELARLEVAYNPNTIAQWTHEVERMRGIKPDRLYACGAARCTFYLGPTGMLQPCLSSVHVQESLREQTVEQAIERLRERLRERALPPDYPCQACPDRPFCQSCPAVARLDGGGEDGISLYRCKVARARATLYGALKDEVQTDGHAVSLYPLGENNADTR